MEQALMTRSTGSSVAVAAPKNAFEAYSDSVAGNRIVGDLLRFAKGDWLAGKDKMDVSVGTQLVAAVEETVIGWILWQDDKIADARMGRVADGFQPEPRRELGLTDETDWPIDDQGQPQDPWRLTSYVILKATDSDQLYTYTPSSAGGRNAVAKLCGEYGKHSRQKPNEFPIVALKVDSYEHKEKRRGRIKVPVLQIVGWTDKAAIMAAIAGEAREAAEGEGEATEPEKAPAKDRKTVSEATQF